MRRPLCRAPRHRSMDYDLRRASRSHPHLALQRNRVGLVQRFPRLRHADQLLAVVLQFLDRLLDVGQRLVLAFLRNALQQLRAASAAQAPSAWTRRGCGSGSSPRAPASSARGSAGPGRSCCRTSATPWPGCARAGTRAPAPRPRPRRASTPSTLSIRPQRPCVPLVPRVHRRQARRRSGGRPSTGASATPPSSLSVTTTAISMIRSRVGLQSGHLEVDPDQAVGVLGHCRLRVE